jgi:hypothetical protein
MTGVRTKGHASARVEFVGRLMASAWAAEIGMPVSGGYFVGEALVIEY